MDRGRGLSFRGVAGNFYCPREFASLSGRKATVTVAFAPGAKSIDPHPAVTTNAALPVLVPTFTLNGSVPLSITSSFLISDAGGEEGSRVLK